MGPFCLKQKDQMMGNIDFKDCVIHMGFVLLKELTKEPILYTKMKVNWDDLDFDSVPKGTILIKGREGGVIHPNKLFVKSAIVWKNKENDNEILKTIRDLMSSGL